MQWQIPEWEKDKMNTGDEDVHKVEIDIENVPDFTVTSKIQIQVILSTRLVRK